MPSTEMLHIFGTMCRKQARRTRYAVHGCTYTQRVRTFGEGIDYFYVIEASWRFEGLVEAREFFARGLQRCRCSCFSASLDDLTKCLHGASILERSQRAQSSTGEGAEYRWMAQSAATALTNVLQRICQQSWGTLVSLATSSMMIASTPAARCLL